MANTLQICVGPAIAAFTISGDAANMPKPICQDSQSKVTVAVARSEPTSITVGPDEIRDFIETLEAEKLMPSIEVLERMAAEMYPPQSWFDEELEDA